MISRYDRPFPTIRLISMIKRILLILAGVLFDCKLLSFLSSLCPDLASDMIAALVFAAKTASISM